MDELFDPTILPPSVPAAAEAEAKEQADQPPADEPHDDAGYTEEEDAAIQQRLADLGYL